MPTGAPEDQAAIQSRPNEVQDEAQDNDTTAIVLTIVRRPNSTPSRLAPFCPT
jgi:hypothetical protein